MFDIVFFFFFFFKKKTLKQTFYKNTSKTFRPKTLGLHRLDMNERFVKTLQRRLDLKP